MNNALKKLLEAGSESLCNAGPTLNTRFSKLAGLLINDLLEMLKKKNGFYAFESALHVFSTQSIKNEIGIEEWNAPALWKNEYANITTDCLFFAENIFGDQFCIKDNEVYFFNSETEELKYIASNLNGWAQYILDNHEVVTGSSLAHRWQELKGAIPSGMRLLPKIPFIVGGDFSIENLYLLESATAMRLRASIANQVRELPDGSAIKLTVID